jgi:peptide/nickel transport system permease protein
VTGAARLDGMPILALGAAVFALALSLASPYIVPHDPLSARLEVRQLPPILLPGGSSDHPLGTDLQGRDVLSRLMVGAQTSMGVAVLSILLGGSLGTTLGLVAGYWAGAIGALIMRAVDVTLSFPSVLLALLLAVTFEPSFWTVVGVIGFVLWARFARIVRGDALALREREFITAARAVGCSPPRILIRHVLPNVLGSILVLTTLQVGWAIIIEASLSFLGAGVPPPTPTWGGMIAEGRNHMDTVWWVAVFPGLAILVVVLSFNTLGDWLRDTFDPKLHI